MDYRRNQALLAEEGEPDIRAKQQISLPVENPVGTEQARLFRSGPGAERSGVDQQLPRQEHGHHQQYYRQGQSGQCGRHAAGLGRSLRKVISVHIGCRKAHGYYGCPPSVPLGLAGAVGPVFLSAPGSACCGSRGTACRSRRTARRIVWWGRVAGRIQAAPLLFSGGENCTIIGAHSPVVFPCRLLRQSKPQTS